MCIRHTSSRIPFRVADATAVVRDAYDAGSRRKRSGTDVSLEKARAACKPAGRPLCDTAMVHRAVLPFNASLGNFADGQPRQ